ncbi:MAG: preprotein translocase subunit SecG [Pirellulaceae bacterium]
MVGIMIAASVWQALFGMLMFLVSVFLILLVLVQRGRGGGLAGALGGMGGQSAFGTKAGDTFTRITIVAATLWILLCMLAVYALRYDPKTDGALAGRGEDRPSAGADADGGAGLSSGTSDSGTSDSGTSAGGTGEAGAGAAGTGEPGGGATDSGNGSAAADGGAGENQ